MPIWNISHTASVNRSSDAMRKALLLLVLAVLPSAVLVAQDHEIRVEKSVMVPMRDGVRLSTDLYFPDGADGSLPAILVKTMYGKSQVFNWDPLLMALVRRGYVVAVQDDRGRYESEGKYSYASGRREDGYDTVSWLSNQPWSNQKIGSAGCSYQGETQLVLAAAWHPNHVVALPKASASGFYTAGRGQIEHL